MTCCLGMSGFVSIIVQLHVKLCPFLHRHLHYIIMFILCNIFDFAVIRPQGCDTVLISQEQEEILEQVYALRSSSNDNAKRIGSNSRYSLLMDEIIAQTHNQCLDNITLLIRGVFK